jgi:hypothetical protein
VLFQSIKIAVLLVRIRDPDALLFLCRLPSHTRSAARHARAALAVTMASRFEDDLTRAHQRPIERFRRAVRQVISRTREARSQQASMQARQSMQTTEQLSPLGDAMVRELSRQVGGRWQEQRRGGGKRA